MAIYFKDKEITNIDSLIPQTGLDITDIWFGNTNIYTVWQVYEGTLPTTLNANGDDMRQYQVYGADGGVGDRTVQLFDKNATDTSNGYVANAYLYTYGNEVSDENWDISEYINITEFSDVTIKNANINSPGASIAFYDENKTYISRAAYNKLQVLTVSVPNDAVYCRFSVRKSNTAIAMLTPGTTPPETYVPFGYKLPMIVFGGYQIYNNTLPAQISSNGMNFKNYRIFGAVGGVGDRTVQLFDKNATDTDNGYVSGAYIKSDGELQNSSTWFVSEYIPVNAEEQYTIVYGSIASSRAVCYYDNNKTYISGANYSGLSAQETITTPSTCAYMRLSLVLTAEDTITVTPGTTPPETFVPFGYEVPIGVKSGNIVPKFTNQSQENLTLTVQNDGSIKINGSDSNNAFFYMPISLSEGVYSMNNFISIEDAGTSTLRVDIRRGSNDGTIIASSNAVDNGSGKTFSVSAADAGQLYYVIRVAANYQADNVIVRPCMVTGDTIPIKYQPCSNTTMPIYIGDTRLEKDEYIDYQAGKVYRRTVNEFDKDNTEIYNAYINVSVDRWLPAEDGSQSVIMQCSPSTEYTLSVPSELSIFRIAESSNGSITPSGGSTSAINVIINSTNSKYTFTTSQDTQCLIFQGNAALVDEWFNGLMLVKGDTATETSTPYLQSTDPPVPLPALPTCDGTTIVDYEGLSIVPSRFYGTYINSPILPVYIGSDPLEKGEYVDYQTGKIYRKKQVYTDTVTIDGIVWDILGYDHDTVYKSDNTLAQHSVTIQTHDVLLEMQYDAKEALFAFDSGLSAGTYHFTVGAQSWYSDDINKTIQFTLTQALPAGGQLVIDNAYNATMIGSTISSYASGTATTATETVTMSEGSDGTDLGTVTNGLSQDGVINSIQRALLGSNKWSESCIRQYLNSSASAGSVWEPKTKWDRPPSWAANTAGFLNGMSTDFIANLGTTSKTTALNTVTDGGGTGTTLDKIFLLSRSEVYGGNEVDGGDGAVYPYYANYSSLSGAETGSDSNRIKYRNEAAKAWWLRSSSAGSASNARSMYSSGTVGNSTASSTIGVALACCIPLDDIASNDWLREKFLKPVDPPVSLAALPTCDGETIVDYAGQSVAIPEKVEFKYRKKNF